MTCLENCVDVPGIGEVWAPYRKVQKKKKNGESGGA